MIAKAKVGLLVAGIGVVVAAASSVPAAGDRPAADGAATGTRVGLGFFGSDGGVADTDGIVAARQRGRRLRVTVSLHGVEPDVTYVVSGNRKPCSVVDAADYVVWRVEAKSERDKGLFGSARVRRNGSLRSVRSVRVEGKRPDGTAIRRVCSGKVSYSVGK